MQTDNTSSFMQVAGQQAAKAKEAQERTVVSKLDKVKVDQTRRADALAKEAEEAELRVGSWLSCFESSSVMARSW